MDSEQGNSYESCIRIYGKPIPPPIMDDTIRQEMRRYKTLAINLEKKLDLKRTERVVSRVSELIEMLESSSPENIKRYEREYSDDTTHDSYSDKIFETLDLKVHHCDLDKADSKKSVSGNSAHINDRADLNLPSTPCQEDNSSNGSNSSLNHFCTTQETVIDDNLTAIKKFEDGIDNKFLENHNDSGEKFHKVNVVSSLPSTTNPDEDVQQDAKVKDSPSTLNHSELASSFVYQSDSTDLSPYMNGKAENINAAKEPSAKATINPLDLLHSDNYNGEADHSDASSISSVTDLQLKSHDKGSSFRVRKNSYTLETPSPALLKSLSKMHLKDYDSSTDTSDDCPIPMCNDKTNCEVESTDCKSSSYFPPLSDKVVKEKGLPYLSRNSSIFPGINDAHSSSSNLSTHPTLTRTERSSSMGSVMSLEEVITSQQTAFQKFQLDLQKQHQLQVEALLKQQWSQQVELQKKFVQMQDSHLQRISSVNGSSFEDCTPSKLDESRSPSSLPDLRKSADKFDEEISHEMMKKFHKLSAMIKGHLTRQLMKTDQVQNQIQTIKDTLNFALKFQSETPIKNNEITAEDVALHRRLISQVTAACHQLHDLFFNTSKVDQMRMIYTSSISRSERSKQTKILKDARKKRLSDATLKYLARKNNLSSLKMKIASPDRIRNQKRSSSAISPYRNTGLKNVKPVTRKGSESVRRKLYAALNEGNKSPVHKYQLDEKLSKMFSQGRA